MKKLFAIFLLALVIAVPVAPSLTYAQVPSIDAVKTPSKISKFVNNIKAKVVHAYKWVADSKFGTFIGNSIDATKDGIGFAKDMYTGAMKVYGKVEGKISDVKNSKEVRMAEVSQKIAAESKSLQSMQEQKLKIAESYKQDLDLSQQVLSEKVASLRENDRVAGGDSSGEIDALETKQLQKENQMKKDYEQDTDELDVKIKAQMKVIAKLTKELSEIADVKVTSENPLEVMEKTQKELFLQQGEALTTDKRAELREKFFAERRKVIYKAYEKALKAKSELDALHEEVQSVQDLAASMPGKSEASGANTEVLVRQADILRRYVEFVLADLELETTVAMASLDNYESSDRLSKFKLCNYTDQTSGLKSLKEKAASAKDQVGGAVSQGQQLKQQYDEKKESATQKVNDVKEMNNQIQDLKDNADAVGKGFDPQSAVKDML